MASSQSVNQKNRNRRSQVNAQGYVEGPLKWGIALAASLGAILEVIDTSIVNVALTDMQANLGATVSEIGWVVTSYAIANVIMIPLTAWLGEHFGRKRYFIFSLIGFTVASMMCGFALNLPMLVLSRFLQGLCGGGLLAKAQSILFETFPPAEQGIAQAVFGVGVIAGPAIGPTMGGILTDTLGWRWIFFVNLPFGILAVLAASVFLLPDRLNHDRQSKVDWWGIILLAAAVGSLQTVLEEGERDDWFSSRLIVTLTITTVVTFGLFIWRELTISYPAVDLRVLRHRSLAAGSLYSAVVGMGLYGTLFVVPIFTQSVLKFTATQTGFLLAPGALASAITMIILGKLTSKIDVRVIIATGAIGTYLVMLDLNRITLQTGAEDLFWPLLFRGAVTVLMFLPLSLASLGSLPKQDIPAGSGFYNLTRQLGGSFGIAILTTVLQQREKFHQAVLTSHVTPYDTSAQDQLKLLTGLYQSRGFDPVTAQQQALANLNQQITIQADILAFQDLFWIVGLIFICSLPLVFLLKRPKGNGGAAAAH